MKSKFPILRRASAVLCALACFTGCESTDGGGDSVSGSAYYGVGFHDPWYYGGYGYDDPDIIVTPPSRPSEPPPRPTHPIAPAPRPMPSIPAMPRPSPRR